MGGGGGGGWGGVVYAYYNSKVVLNPWWLGFINPHPYIAGACIQETTFFLYSGIFLNSEVKFMQIFFFFRK